MSVLPILQVGDVLISPDILTEYFCCDLTRCGGMCCVEGDAGAPVTPEEIAEIEEVMPTVWDDLAVRARGVLNRQGVAYIDREGDLVTSIVDGKDCCFTCYARLPEQASDASPVCLCAIEKAWREGRLPQFDHCPKPMSCFLYPVREKRFANGTVGLNYNRWTVCQSAVACGRERGIKVWQFLREPLTRRFGAAWYAALSEVAAEVEKMADET